MRVDFYVLGSDPTESVVAALAARVLDAGQRLLVVAADPVRRVALSRALWENAPERFLANGDAGEAHAARQPILLSDTAEPVNRAVVVCLADGEWRDTSGFERVLYLVDKAHLPKARGQWKRLSEADAATDRHFWKQDQAGRWREGP